MMECLNSDEPGDATFGREQAKAKALEEHLAEKEKSRRTAKEREGPKPRPRLRLAAPSVFYKNAFAFKGEKKRPLPPTCSVRALCDSAPALYKCHDCAAYDPAGKGYHCSACYEKRHPAHRAKHNVIHISQAEDFQIDLEKASYRAEVDEVALEASKLLQIVTEWRQGIQEESFSARSSSNLSKAQTTADAVEQRLADIVESLREGGCDGVLPIEALNDARVAAHEMQWTYERDKLRSQQQKTSLS
jgi:hypothetical protein